MAGEKSSREASAGVLKEDSSNKQHPSRNLASRARGYGIAAGFEKPYRTKKESPLSRSGEYGPIPHSGYYGAGDGAFPFKRGQAGYSEELLWYPPQYGEMTSGCDPEK